MKRNITSKKRHLFHKLNIKFLIGFSLLAIALSLCSYLIGYSEYKSNIEKLNNDFAYAIAYETSSLVDGDALETYAKTLTPDKNYEIMRDNIEILHKNMNTTSIFIVRIDVPEEGSCQYLLDIVNPPLNPMILGEVASYPKDIEEELKGCFFEGKDYSNKYIQYKSNEYGYTSISIVPVYNSNGNIVAVLVVQSNINKIKQKLFQYLVFATLLTIILVIVFFSIYLVYLNWSLINPIKKITLQASEFVNKDNKLSDSFEQIHTGDEIETLSIAMMKMEHDIHQYIENLACAAATQDHMTTEFNIARQIQQSLFPCQFPAFPERKEFDIYAELQPCDAVGGNFYNFFLIDENHLCIFLGDVSGNGIPTSMFSVIATTLISNYASQKLPPDKILVNVNNGLSRNNNAELIVDAFLAIINLNTGRLTFSTAGNINMLMKRPGSEFQPLLFKKCFPLAAMEQVQYVNQNLTLSQGDILFLYTKGIAESVNDKGMIFGSNYAKEKIDELVMQDYSLKTITEHFYQFITEFQNGSKQSSDSTILLFRYTGK